MLAECILDEETLVLLPSQRSFWSSAKGEDEAEAHGDHTKNERSEPEQNVPFFFTSQRRHTAESAADSH